MEKNKSDFNLSNAKKIAAQMSKLEIKHQSRQKGWRRVWFTTAFLMIIVVYLLFNMKGLFL